MARQKLDPAAPSLADMFTAGIGQAPEVPKPSKNAPPPIAPGVHLAGQMNGEAEAARARAYGTQRPEVQTTPPAEADNLHARMDANRSGRNDGKKRHAAKVAAKKGDITRPIRAQKIRDARRQKAIARQREGAKTNPLLGKDVNSPEAQQLRQDVRTTARVLFETGAMGLAEIAEKCGVEANTVHQWKHRYGWTLQAGATPKVIPAAPRRQGHALHSDAKAQDAIVEADEGARVAGHRFDVKIAKEGVADARQQAQLEYVLRGTMNTEAREQCKMEAVEDEGSVSTEHSVVFQGFEDIDCVDSKLMIWEGMGESEEKGLQGGSVEQEKILSPAVAASHDMTMPPIVGAVIAANATGEREKWNKRRDEWREKTHKILNRAMDGFETLPDVLLTDKDTTRAMRDVQEMGRRNLDLEGDHKVGGGGNLLVSILAAPVGVAVQIEHRAA